MSEYPFHERFGEYDRIPVWIYSAEGVGLKDIQLYGAILSYGGKSGKVLLSNLKLAEMINSSERKVRQGLDFLKSCGAIRVEIEKGYKRTIVPMEVALNPYKGGGSTVPGGRKHSSSIVKIS